MTNPSRTALEAVFDSPSLRARIHRRIHEGVVRLVSAGLRMAGPRVARRLPDLSLVEVVHRLPRLPAEFDGYRLLQVSDLHLESLPRMDAAFGVAAAARWDGLVCTGDVAEGPHAASLIRRFFGPLRASRTGPWTAVLGNHDRTPVAAALTDAGFVVLMNAAFVIERAASRLWLAGVDDPATFRTADLDAALSRVRAGEFAVLLAHSPDLADSAARRGCALYLCGHTHGGQVVLPGLGPLLYRQRYPRERIAGPWHTSGMLGYTSVGVGAHHGLVRVGCSPELTIHELRRG